MMVFPGKWLRTPQVAKTARRASPPSNGKPRRLAARRGTRGGHATTTDSSRVTHAYQASVRSCAARGGTCRQRSGGTPIPANRRLNDVILHAGSDTPENVLCGHVDCATDKSPTSWKVTSRFRGSDG
ncbi:uncharacterized protein PITG_17565 [Phytophthora infestans T30-4]|uniref:Uncharacterized protein n=1 Tax=Phytophthora infestans (strain T30-4) TaxID=403677 RepID=D0NWN8_PHYIT|nr:uncharacterized protein PITG_17565 [Phytophthora infestans T30-4]EEY67471.1 hypothetical protein PITG_17565 [Phytophthora infestans T30-4]|eukprot:XP_002896444.1 hypothetical protein PITG_17565 [Phytophthora infestans T30-4]